MNQLAVALLVVGVIVMFWRPVADALWIGPCVAALIGLATTAIPWRAATDVAGDLRNPLLFLVFAVPLAVVLDNIGVFEALAAMVDGGRHVVAWLWLLAAAVTIVFNLDAAVVLLTPLYIRIAQRNGYSVEALAFQPALLACLVSHPLPVSNLTNLIVAERFHLGADDFIVNLALPTVAAGCVGYVCYRRAFHFATGEVSVDRSVDRAALVRGLPIIAFVLVGFTVGDVIGVAAWVVAAVAFAAAAVMDRSVPWRIVPVEAIAVALGLAVLVAGALPHLHLDRLLSAEGIGGRLQAVLFGVVASDATNNLPAVLAGSASIADRDRVWSLLIGVNVGPVLVISGSLSGLLWRDTARRLGVDVSIRRYSAVGFRVGLPALLVAAAVVVLM